MMKRFHIHIYFEPGDVEEARALAGRARDINLFESVKLHERPIGPHPIGMIEAHFRGSAYDSVMGWVEANRGFFSALIHPDTGDDFKDHTDEIRWLGKELPLNFTFFEWIRMRPEFRIHS
jgi:aromatic ring-cleaving dioxygenase